jgi:hypothetical protein
MQTRIIARDSTGKYCWESCLFYGLNDGQGSGDPAQNRSLGMHSDEFQLEGGFEISRGTGFSIQYVLDNTAKSPFAFLLTDARRDRQQKSTFARVPLWEHIKDTYLVDILHHLLI